MTPETLASKLRSVGYESPHLPHLCRGCDAVLASDQISAGYCRRCAEEIAALTATEGSRPGAAFWPAACIVLPLFGLLVIAAWCAGKLLRGVL